MIYDWEVEAINLKCEFLFEHLNKITMDYKTMIKEVEKLKAQNDVLTASVLGLIKKIEKQKQNDPHRRSFSKENYNITDIQSDIGALIDRIERMEKKIDILVKMHIE